MTHWERGNLRSPCLVFMVSSGDTQCRPLRCQCLFSAASDAELTPGDMRSSPVTRHLASHCPASLSLALIQQEKSLAGNKIPVNIVYDFQQNEVTVKFPYSIEMTGTTLPGRGLCLSWQREHITLGQKNILEPVDKMHLFGRKGWQQYFPFLILIISARSFLCEKN